METLEEAYINLCQMPIAERVSNGARWLDENFPGWMDRIDLDTLDLSSSESCICGQVFEKQAVQAQMSGRVFHEYDVPSGYDFATKTLFTEANSWITGLVWYETAEVDDAPDARMTPEMYNRVYMVSAALGFGSIQMLGSVMTEAMRDAYFNKIESGDNDSSVWDTLQDAWGELLEARGA
jgi:hypothetical protein